MFIPRNHGEEPYVVVSERQCSLSYARCKCHSVHDLSKVSFGLITFCSQGEVYVSHNVNYRRVDIGAEFNLMLHCSLSVLQPHHRESR